MYIILQILNLDFRSHIVTIYASKHNSYYSSNFLFGDKCYYSCCIAT